MNLKISTSSPECPVDLVTVNDNKIRLVALQVFMLSILFLLIDFWPGMVLLVIDFFARSTGWGKFSLLSFIAEILVKLIKVGEKPVDQAPKRFAARIGLVLTLLTAATWLLHFTTASFTLGCVLAFFSFLESFFGFCAGCWGYYFFKRLLPS
ncbi:MAG: DUF4395 domain-containing protein [Flammeovirgaceae bacterium]